LLAAHLDLALAQDERCERRYCSLSAQIMRAKQDYQAALEQAQRGGLDITGWLLWFLRQVRDAARDGVREVGLVLARSCFWERAKACDLNHRQRLALGSLLSPRSQDLAVSNRSYRAITKTSRATASRDLAELARLGLVVPFG
jgi:Fic family protein